MTDLKQEDFVKIYEDAIYELNAEILFSIAYTETEKDVYKLNEGIKSITFTKKIDKNERKNVIQKFIDKIFKHNIDVYDEKDTHIKTIQSNNFKEKLEYFKEQFYKKKKENFIKNINNNFP